MPLPKNGTPVKAAKIANRLLTKKAKTKFSQSREKVIYILYFRFLNTDRYNTI